MTWGFSVQRLVTFRSVSRPLTDGDGRGSRHSSEGARQVRKRRNGRCFRGDGATLVGTQERQLNNSRQVRGSSLQVQSMTRHSPVTRPSGYEPLLSCPDGSCPSAVVRRNPGLPGSLLESPPLTWFVRMTLPQHSLGYFFEMAFRSWTFGFRPDGPWRHFLGCQWDGDPGPRRDWDDGAESHLAL